MLDVARCLPAIRERVLRDLAATGLTRERVLASAVRLLDLGFFRVGGEDYAESNGSYGQATTRHGRSRVDVRSADINEHLRLLCGGSPITAKEVRTLPTR